MERHTAKRLGVGCAVISAPMHVQDFPARFSPQMGFEGANVLFDTWVHPLMMGLEEHLIGMFREDFEFNDVAPSHLGHKAAANVETPAQPVETPVAVATMTEPVVTMATTVLEAHAPMVVGEPTWGPDAEAELRKIPFFVRGKARRNTESYARLRSVSTITVETLYDAKAHFSK
jgi:light-independent protochlorophyllide reductase subunit B